MGEVKLLPCPFCGDTEEVETRYQDKAWRVHCGSCGGCAYGWETEGQAIATWNARPKLREPSEAMIEAGIAALNSHDLILRDGYRDADAARVRAVWNAMILSLREEG